MDKLKVWFASLQSRERIAVGVAAVLVSFMVIYVLALAPFYRSVNEREERIARKKEDLAWMRSVAAEVQALSASQPNMGAPSGESLVVLVSRTARDAGLGSSLSSQPNGTTGIRVSLENAGFDMLMVWLSGLNLTQGVTIESATINRAGKPGLVNVSLELNRPGG